MPHATLQPARALHRPGTPGYRRLNLAMVAVGSAAFGLLYATQPILPQVGREYAVPAASAALTVSAATGALALLVVPATAVGLRLGRVRTIRWALLAAVVLTGLAAVAPTYEVLVGVRGLTGAALAAVVAVAMGHVAAEVHPSGLAGAMGLYVAGNSLGGVGGRLVTAGVADWLGWRGALGVLAAVALVATAVVWWLAEDTPAPGSARGADRARLPWRSPALWAVLALPFLLMGGFVATYNYLSYRLVAPPFGLPASVVGLVFLAYLAGTLSSAGAGRLAQRWGRAPVLVASVLLMAAGLALTLPDRLPVVVVGLLVATAGFFAAHAVGSGWAPVVGGAAATQASALYVASYYAGSSVFGALVGLAWSGAAWPGVVAAVGALVALALGAALVLARAAPTPPDPTR